jgi:hypothetical protein
VCRYSPHHETVVAAREVAQTDELVYRAMRSPRRRVAARREASSTSIRTP